jgi:anaphase-promoting complex subunit 6
MQSLLLDVKNYDAFRELVEGNMLTPAEGKCEMDQVLGVTLRVLQLGMPRLMRPEWEFVNNLAYRSQLSEEESNFVRLMYRLA